MTTPAMRTLIGALLVDKPAGPTSHDVVAAARQALGTRAVGHTGTLDPFATGLLIVMVGRATRLARFVEAQPKTYLATARLGVRTDTDDLTGAPLGDPIEPSALAERDVRRTLAELEGAGRQRPPSFSAKRVAGERSYRLARRGAAVELPKVDVTVHRIELVDYDTPLVTFRATVSAGTYVRALARDLGEKLGVGAHLVALRRESIGDVSVDEAVPLERISLATMVPARRVLGHLPAVELNENERRAVSHGRGIARPVDDAATASVVRLMADGDVVAIAESRNGWLQPIVVLESR